MSIADNLSAIQTKIVDACRRVDRDPSEVLLLAVSKGHSVAAIEEAASAGLTVFGESKVQEAKTKIPQCPGHLRYQMIGHLQTNKCRDAVQLFELIQSVDSLHLATEINKRSEQASKTMPILLEVNVAGESSKFGYSPEKLIEDLDGLNALSRVEIHGLMTIAPYTAEPENARPYFQQLRELKQTCEHQLGAPLPQLSMGMSGDFEIAIEEGATIVRVGTSLFGKRDYSRKV